MSPTAQTVQQELLAAGDDIAKREEIIRNAMMQELRKEAREAEKERQKSDREIDYLRARGFRLF